MIRDTQWTPACLAAALNLSRVHTEVESLSTCLNVTLITEMSAIEAHIKSNVAAETTLVVNVLRAMAKYIALSLAKTELFRQALVAHEVLRLLLLSFFLHFLAAVQHANEVWFLTLGTEVKCALMQCQFTKVAIELVLWIDKAR